MEDYRYIEILIEDQSGGILVNEIMKKYQNRVNGVTYNINSFKGIGKIPANASKVSAIKTKRLLTDLPMYLNGLNSSLKHMDGKGAIFVILDVDDEDCSMLKKSLVDMRDSLGLAVKVYFCFAIEEMEAWLLGDWEAIQLAYPNAKRQLFQKYTQDSIIGTWEFLADVVYVGGVARLKKESVAYREIGKFKCDCAKNIGQYLDINRNNSQSFKYLIKKLDDFCEFQMGC